MTTELTVHAEHALDALLTPSMRPWDRLGQEPDLAWQAFQIYRDTPQTYRSINVVGGATPRWRIAEWMQSWHWVERVHRYDTFFAELAHETRVNRVMQTASDAAEEQLRALSIMRHLATQELEKLAAVAASTDAPGVIKANDVVKMLESAIKHERLIRGEATSRAATQIDLSGMTEEEINLILGIGGG